MNEKFFENGIAQISSYISLENIIDRMKNFVSEYFSSPINTIKINGTSLSEYLQSSASYLDSQISKSGTITADEIISIIDSAFSLKYGFTLSGILSESFVNNIKSNLEEVINNDTSNSQIDSDQVINIFDSALGNSILNLGIGVVAISFADLVMGDYYVFTKYVWPVIAEQVFASGSDSLKISNEPGDIIFQVYNQLSGNVTEESSVSTLSSSDNVYTYSGGYAVINDYTSDKKINYSAEYTGVGISDDDFVIKSTTGTLTIQNVRDKWIDVADSNGIDVGHAYMTSNEGEVSGKNYFDLEVLIGADNLSNTIIAGNGGSSLWGGTYSDDTLVGGSGKDVFFYGQNDGSDVIVNASSNDVVILYNVSLSDIISTNVEGNVISATFNNGNTLKINSSDSVSSIFQLTDGSWQFNHSTNSWEDSSSKAGEYY